MNKKFCEYPVRIANARKAKGLSREKLALEVGVTAKTISKIEQGISNPKLETVYRISEALEVPLSEMVGQTMRASELTEADLRQVIVEAIRVVGGPK